MNFQRFGILAAVIVSAAGSAFAGAGLLTADAYVSTSSPGTNFGAAPLLNVGGANSALLQFDLSRAASALFSGIPNGNTTVTIGRGLLRVYANKVVAAGTLTVSPVTSAWIESAVTSGTVPTFDPFVGSAPLTTGNQFIEVDITSTVQQWLNGSVTNLGLYLASPDGGVFVLDSKEATTTSHQAELVIELAADYGGVLKKSLTLSSPGFTSLMSIHLTGTKTAGGRISYTIRATDGGSQIATESGIIQYLATANSITCTVQTTDKLHLGTVNSGCTPGFFNPLSQPGVSIFDNVTFSSPAPIVVHEVTYQILTQSSEPIRLEP